MVVDDVEHHAEAEVVGTVDERPQLLGRAVAGLRRKDQRAVIAPAALAGEVVERHDLEAGVAGGPEVLEFDPSIL